MKKYCMGHSVLIKDFLVDMHLQLYNKLCRFLFPVDVTLLQHLLHWGDLMWHKSKTISNFGKKKKPFSLHVLFIPKNLKFVNIYHNSNNIYLCYLYLCKLVSYSGEVRLCDSCWVVVNIERRGKRREDIKLKIKSTWTDP